jgi:chaperonin GroES
MDLQPLGDRLIVEALEEDMTTSSGIVLPDTAKEKPQRGKVLAVGPGARNDAGEIVPMEVAVGDEIIYSKYGGTDIKLGADEVLILRESDVLAKVTSKGAKASKKKELAGASA